MPSVFPGMDPIIESQVWPEFHLVFIAAFHERLARDLRPRYVVRAEERVYVEQESDAFMDYARPDVTILQGADRVTTAGGGTATAVAPVPRMLPVPERMREAFLTVRSRESLEVVAIIEILSPANKRPGSDGRSEYLKKRQAVLQSAVHLVELDLLRGGQRMPLAEPFPPGDYCALVSRAGRRPVVDVYAWSLRHPLPPIAIPLAGDDPDAIVDLQALFNVAYDRAGYDYSLDYRQPILPPLSDEDAAWAREIAAGTGSAM